MDKIPPIGTWADLFAYIKEGGSPPVSRILGVPKQTASDWRRYGIGPRYWSRLVAWAETNGKTAINYELLGRLAADDPPRVAAE